MQTRPALGEVVFTALLAVLGIIWIVAALRMPFWEGFAPQSGFMPLWYGIILTALSAAILANLYMQKEPGKAEQPIRKPLIVLAALAAGIAGLELVGFGPSVFLLLLVLFAAVERLPIGRSVLVATGTTAALLLIFKTWLGVTLPIGPLGI
jgi:Tripartite tricarboxylate transporter TctB family